MLARLTSHRPYTASRTSSGEACFTLYQRSHSPTSWIRKSAERSTTRTPASSSARASVIATPFGVAKKTTSHFASAAGSGSANARDRCPRRLGNISDMQQNMQQHWQYF